MFSTLNNKLSFICSHMQLYSNIKPGLSTTRNILLACRVEWYKQPMFMDQFKCLSFLVVGPPIVCSCQHWESNPGCLRERNKSVKMCKNTTKTSNTLGCYHWIHVCRRTTSTVYFMCKSRTNSTGSKCQCTEINHLKYNFSICVIQPREYSIYSLNQNSLQQVFYIYLQFNVCQPTSWLTVNGEIWH